MNNLEEIPSAYYRHQPKNYDRNFYTASIHIITIILTWMSVLQNDWFQMEFGVCKSQLSIKQLLPFLNNNGSASSQTVQTDSFLNEICPTIDFADLTPKIVNLMRVSLHLCIWAIFFSAVAFYFDFFGSVNKLVKIIRRNAVPGIMTVMLISFLIADCYYISVLLGEMLEEKFPEFFFTVSYGSGFYTITAAGVVAAMATSITLLLAPLPTDDIIERL